MKDADHFDKIKRIKVSEKDLAPFLPHYGVRHLNYTVPSLLIDLSSRLLSIISKTCIPAKFNNTDILITQHYTDKATVNQEGP